MTIYQNIDLQWFAAEDEGRTEQPSELKLKKAREEGRVAKSQDLNGAIVFLASFDFDFFRQINIVWVCGNLLLFF